MSGLTRVRVSISGRVQGVWFRDSCREEARALGVAGWVRNCVDGVRVEAEFEGPEAAVARMVAWSRQGPPRAGVDEVHVEPLSPTGEQGFRVR
ncbi:MAG: acylphosphatase [Actinomycetota bacterium]|nr:acylphosphatase [Actinomycetota bacterium]